MYNNNVTLHGLTINESIVFNTCQIHNVSILPGVQLVAFINCKGMNIKVAAPMVLVFDNCKIMNIKYPEGTKITIIGGELSNLEEIKLVFSEPVGDPYRGEIVTPTLDLSED